jgi:hypothetical protein
LIDSKGRNFGGFGLAYAEMAALKRKGEQAPALHTQ